MLASRTNAGFKLAEQIRAKKLANPFVIALSRGGVLTSIPIVEILNAEFDLLYSRKLKQEPDEVANFGTITEDGCLSFNGSEAFYTDDELLKIVKRAESALISDIYEFRLDVGFADLEGKDVIIVDDGATTGARIKAGIRSVIQRKASSISVAVPVMGSWLKMYLGVVVNDVYCLHSDDEFSEKKNYYRDYSKVDDSIYYNRLGILKMFATNGVIHEEELEPEVA
ncbi:MAG: hypothetical protein KAG96_05240 [Ichthyobacteriaceae bacterium]|nr:hypothetical protein [Ichthyobacteriaceae bacterium]